jgi:hypothetical protein
VLACRAAFLGGLLSDVDVIVAGASRLCGWLLVRGAGLFPPLDDEIGDECCVSGCFALEVVMGEFLGSCARQRFVKPGADRVVRGVAGAAAEIVGDVEHGGVVAMAGERDVGRVAIKVRGCEDVGFVDGGALGFVDGGGVAVVEMLVELGVDMDAGAGGAVEFDGEDAGFDAFDDSEGAVLDAEVSFIAEEADAVVDGEGFLAVVGGDFFALP